MTERRTSIFENGLIWFGAGVSLAEIITGTYLAPLGFARGLAAILLGHLIGCLLLFLSGVIGGKRRCSSMESVKLSFGQKGALLFAALNVLQLLGWTGIMIYDGALAANGIWGIGRWIWCLLIGGLIVLWILIGIRNLGKVNTISMSALFLLTIVLSVIVFGKDSPLALGEEAMSFGAAVELSVAMPLSWLPLISDYTREAKDPVRASAVSALVYGLVSCWMYVIGMGAAIFTGEYDVAMIMLRAGLGVAGLIIVVFSTVTTTFLDAYSAGVSCETILPRSRGKWFAVAAAVLGTLGAVFFPMDDITNFLYLIGSVFAPMIAIQIADAFLLKADRSDSAVDIRNMIVWLLGFVIYRLLMRTDLPVGNTLPDMLITMLLCVLTSTLGGKKNLSQ
ncbi:MAG: putative hydroxymethylpyrimidine transporter CytX [Oscillospiraceae bacterium]|nr:putative hydroxymethylpyrimidine transporter CytX [Oscillospiraceae bacterium]